MPILFLALIALAVFGGIGILLSLAVIAEHRHQRTKATANGAPLPAAEPEKPLQARAAAQGR